MKSIKKGLKFFLNRSEPTVSHLMSFIEGHDIKEVKQDLQEKPSLINQYRWNRTPLMHAYIEKFYEGLIYLIIQGADLNKPSYIDHGTYKKPYHVLRAAIAEDDIATVRLLILAGAKTDCWGNYNYPKHNQYVTESSIEALKERKRALDELIVDQPQSKDKWQQAANEWGKLADQERIISKTTRADYVEFYETKQVECLQRVQNCDYVLITPSQNNGNDVKNDIISNPPTIFPSH